MNGMKGSATFVMAVVSAMALAQPYAKYKIEALPVANPPGTPRGLSDDGRVAGYVSTSEDAPFYWSRSEGTILPGQYPNNHGTVFNDVNSAGTCVGVTGLSAGLYKALTWSSSGGYKSLNGLPGRGITWAGSVADSGSVCGVSLSLTNGTGRATLWEPGKAPRDLGTIYDQYSEAVTLNNSNEVIGTSSDNNGLHGSWRWSPTDGLSTLSALSLGEEAGVNSINDEGVIVGHSSVGVHARPTLWRRGSGPELGALPTGFTEGGLRFVTNDGLFFGEAVQGLARSQYLWREGQNPMLLTDLMDDSWSGWSLRQVHAFNNAGQFTGTAVYQGVQRTFLATPVPEPSGFLAALPLLLGLGAKRKNRAQKRLH
ncbi:MAG: hypothetical protein JST30_03935 [Armatimonadetes bacterium]|nr:hypothetical protein [Armatimonadota bacterium]